MTFFVQIFADFYADSWLLEIHLHEQQQKQLTYFDSHEISILLHEMQLDD